MTDHAARPTRQIDIPIADWRDAVALRLRQGMTFQSLHGTGPTTMHAVFANTERFEVLTTHSVDASTSIPSIADLIPASEWDEREAVDLAGASITGDHIHPLVHHDRGDRWITPVHGHATHQVAVGPIHAGIIESGHFRFHCVGERILHLDLQLFHKHRGLERAAVGKPLADAVPIIGRACAACHVANSVAYVSAAEQALGLAVDDATRRARMVLIELERLYNHLHDISAICTGIGFAPGAMAFAALKEQAQRINTRLTGHRFLFASVTLGGSSIAATDADVDVVRAELVEIAARFDRAWEQLTFHGPAQNRLHDVGVLTSADARALGIVGPAARASGIDTDERTHPGLLTTSGFRPARPTVANGDVHARTELRAVELTATFALLDELLGRGELSAGSAHPDAAAVAGPVGCATVESPRGRTFCMVEHADGVVQRVRLRTASLANWQAVAHAAANEILPEFPLINKSFELCYACCDR